MTKTEGWTHEDQRLAYASGWGVFDNSDHGTRIERLDDPDSVGLGSEPAFDSDEAALMHVETAASAGDLLARKAIAHVALHGRYSGLNK